MGRQAREGRKEEKSQERCKKLKKPEIEFFVKGLNRNNFLFVSLKPQELLQVRRSGR